MAVGLGGPVFEGGGEGRVQVGRAVEEAFGALGDEFWGRRGGMGENRGRGDGVRQGHALWRVTIDGGRVRGWKIARASGSPLPEGEVVAFVDRRSSPGRAGWVRSGGLR